MVRLIAQVLAIYSLVLLQGCSSRTDRAYEFAKAGRTFAQSMETSLESAEKLTTEIEARSLLQDDAGHHKTNDGVATPGASVAIGSQLETSLKNTALVLENIRRARATYKLLEAYLKELETLAGNSATAATEANLDALLKRMKEVGQITSTESLSVIGKAILKGVREKRVRRLLKRHKDTLWTIASRTSDLVDLLTVDLELRMENRLNWRSGFEARSLEQQSESLRAEITNPVKQVPNDEDWVLRFQRLVEEKVKLKLRSAEEADRKIAKVAAGKIEKFPEIAAMRGAALKFRTSLEGLFDGSISVREIRKIYEDLEKIWSAFRS